MIRTFFFFFSFQYTLFLCYLLQFLLFLSLSLSLCLSVLAKQHHGFMQLDSIYSKYRARMIYLVLLNIVFFLMFNVNNTIVVISNDLQMWNGIA